MHDERYRHCRAFCCVRAGIGLATFHYILTLCTGKYFENARLRITKLTGKLGGMGSTHSLFKLGSSTSTPVDCWYAKTWKHESNWWPNWTPIHMLCRSDDKLMDVSQLATINYAQWQEWGCSCIACERPEHWLTHAQENCQGCLVFRKVDM